MKTRTAFPFVGSAFAVVIALSLAVCGKPTELSGAPPPAVSVGTEIDDRVLTTTIKAALLAQDDVKSFVLKVETRQRDVRRSRFVDNRGQIDQAVRVARDVEGVHSIHGELRVKP